MEYFELASVTKRIQFGYVPNQVWFCHNAFQCLVVRAIKGQPFLPTMYVVNWFMVTVRKVITVPFMNIDNMMDY